MTPTIRLIAVDLDGTLLTRERTLAPRGADRLRQAASQGVIVVLATMRALDTALPFYRELGLQNPMICMNGALVWDGATESAWMENALPRDLALAVAQFADAQALELAITINSVTHVRQRLGQALGEITMAGYRRIVVPTNTAAVTGAVERIMIWEAEPVEKLRAFCEAEFPDQCQLDVHYNEDGSVRSMGIFAPGTNKGAALRLVYERLGIAREHVLALGDNANDLPMFAQAGISVAMGNALDDVKARATLVAPDHDAEGVAWALDQVLPNA